MSVAKADIRMTNKMAESLNRTNNDEQLTGYLGRTGNDEADDGLGGRKCK